MFEDKDLQTFLETSPTIRNKSVITAEWNMNIPTNIKHVGNYRYRPTQTSTPNPISSVWTITPGAFSQAGASGFNVPVMLDS